MTKTSAKRRRNRAKKRNAAATRRETDTRRRWFGGLSVAAVGAVIAVVVSLTSVVDWVERKIDPPDPPVLDAQLLAAELTRERQPLGDYLRDSGQSTEGLSRREAREQGLVFKVRVSIVGATGKSFPLVWTMLDAGSSRPLRDEYLYRQTALEFVPKGSTHNRAWQIWVPYPTQPGRYELELTLMDERKQPVDQRTTEPFRVRSIPELD